MSTGLEAAGLIRPSLWLGVFLVALYLTRYLYGLLIYPLLFRPLRNIPLAPDSHWFFGHFKRILKEPSGSPAREWINTIPNDGMIRYKIFFTSRVLLTKPEALADVTVNNTYDFVKSSFIVKMISRITGIGLTLQEHDVHRVQRKALAPAFTYRHTKNLYPVFWGKARQLVQCLTEASRSDSAIDVGMWASRTTMDIIGIGGMGINFNSLHDPSNRLAQAYRTIVSLPVSSPVGKKISVLRLVLPNAVVNNIPCQYNRDINAAVDTVREAAADLIARKRKSTTETKPGETGVDVLSAALASGQFTDKQLLDHAMTFLAAGHEASANALTIAVMHLCQYPHVQAKLRQEIRQRVPPLSRDTIDPADIDRCHYLQAVCSEVLRIWPPLTQSYRTADRDTTICGQHIPKGTSIVLCFWAINTSKELWGEDALEFKPERWLDAGGRANSGGGATSNFAFSTFLHGPRSCIGQRFAQSGFACILAALIGTFEVEFEKGSALARGEAEFGGTISNKPRGGVWCTFRKIPGWE